MPQTNTPAITKVKFTSIDEYISSFPLEVQSILQTVRQTIQDVAPDAKEKISYNIPAFTWHGSLIYYSAWKNHISLYPASDSMSAAIAVLAPYRAGKGTIKFPMDHPLPLPLVRKIVEFRMAENLAAKTK